MSNEKGKRTPRGFGKYPLVKVGIFDLRKYNSLLQKEVEWLADLNKKKLKSILPIFELTEKIAQDLKISNEQAFTKVTNYSINPDVKSEDTALMLNYLQEIQDISNNSTSEEAIQREAISVFLNARVSPKWLEENKEELFDIFNIDIEKSRDLDGYVSWLPEYTTKLPQDIIDAVIEFFNSEKDPNTQSVESTTTGEALENLPK